MNISLLLSVFIMIIVIFCTEVYIILTTKSKYISPFLLHSFSLFITIYTWALKNIVYLEQNNKIVRNSFIYFIYLLIVRFFRSTYNNNNKIIFVIFLKVCTYKYTIIISF